MGNSMNKEILYQVSLEALEELFILVGEEYWGQWIQKDLQMWVKERTVDHHLDAYRGGMGSFSDLLILRYNGHKLEEGQEPWINACLRGLTSIAYGCARDIENNRNIETPDREETEVIFSGWICKGCGAEFGTEKNVLWAAADLWASSLIKKMLLGRGKDIVKQGYNWEKDPECQRCLAQVRAWIAKKPVCFLTDVFHWERDVCPNCSKKNWAGCRWKIDINQLNRACRGNVAQVFEK